MREREFGGAPGAVGRIAVAGGPAVPDRRAWWTRRSPAWRSARATDIYAPICAQVITSARPEGARRAQSLVPRRHGPPERPACRSRRCVAARRRGAWESTPRRCRPTGAPTISATTSRASSARSRRAGGLSDLRDTYQRALLIVMVVVGVVLLIACAQHRQPAPGARGRAPARNRHPAGDRCRSLAADPSIAHREPAALAVGRGARRRLRPLGQPAAGALLRCRRPRPVWLDLSLDLRVLGFTIGVATVTGVLFGLAPAWRAAHVDPQSAMKSGGRGIAGGDVRHRIGKALVVGQVALSLVLVAAAGLLLGSFHRLVTLDPGFRREGVLLDVHGLRRHRAQGSPVDHVRRARCCARFGQFRESPRPACR